MRKFFLFLFGLAVSLAPAVTSAQNVSVPAAEEDVIVADINISDASIVSRDAGKVVVGFDIENRMNAPQGDLRYGIEIRHTREAGQSVADAVIASETVTLAAGASAHRELTYGVPAFLEGDYDVWVIAQTGSGVIVGIAKAGTISLTASEKSVAIANNSCRLVVGGEEGKTYSLRQGVDIEPGEVLSLVCDMTNGWDEGVNVMPYVETYRRSIYGQSVGSAVAGQDVAFTAGEGRDVTVVIPTQSEPQAFDFKLTLRNAAGKTVSNAVVGHYVIRGVSGTLQNVTIDGDSYAEGDLMTVSGLWTGPADGFYGARGDGSRLSDPMVTVSVTDASGRGCAEPFSSALSDERFSLSGKMIAGCDTPVVTVVLSADGRELDRVTIGGEAHATNVGIVGKIGSTLGVSDLLVRLILVLFLMSVALIVWTLRGRKGVRSFLFLALASAGFGLLLPRDASALSWSVRADDARFDGEAVAWFTVNADSPVYEPGEDIGLSGTARYMTCANGDGVFAVTAEFRGQEEVLLGSGMSENLGYDEDIVMSDYLEGTLTAPSEPGKYFILLDGMFKWDPNPEKSYFHSYARLPIEVVAPNSAPETPIIGGPKSGVTDRGYEFSATATDPDGDGIRYGFDWDDDGEIDLWMPADGYVATGTEQMASRFWQTVGTKVFQVLAEDEDGAVSGWADHSIAISTPPSVLTLCIQGSDADPYTMAKGDSLTMSAHYGIAGDCSDADVTASAAFGDSGSPNDAVTVSGSTLLGAASGSERVSVTYGGQSDSSLVNVTASCEYDCRADQRCQGETYSVTDSCGREHVCTGTRSCDFNWKETTPGE